MSLDYHLNFSFTDKQIKQLINYSNTDPLVKEFTSDKKRFKNLSAFEAWLGKNPSYFVFSDKGENLIALVWFSHKKMPISGFAEFNWSLALRVYGEARGKGLAKEFLNLALTIFKNQSPDRKIWLSTSFDNLAAIKTYQKLGLKKVSEPNEKAKILMVLG